jgi:homoserine dehydrogenase
MLPIHTVKTKFYVRVTAMDRPKVLSSIAGVFGDHEVSIESVVQRANEDGENAEIVWVTHRVPEANLRAALEDIRVLPCVQTVSNCFRVVE